MLYRISSVIWYKTEDLIAHYPMLRDFGLQIIEHKSPKGCWIRDENGNRIWQEMGFTVNYIPHIEINSIEELHKLRTLVKHPLVYCDSDEPEIEIYDGYRE